MSMLASLAHAYERMAEKGDVPPFGYSNEKIGFLISLDEDGSPASVIDLREGESKKKRPRHMAVPQPVKRTSGIAPNFLWDKTSYVLGITAGGGKRLAEEHAAFLERHRQALIETDDPGLRAFWRFLERWTPEDFERLGWPEDMKDQNIVFALEGDRRHNIRMHDRPAARALWDRMQSDGDKAEAMCLVSGKRAPVSRLHPAIKGVWDAQSSGASIVSFNLDAFTSYGHEQGDNAPVSEETAFAYTTVLNKFLERDSGHRVQIGDASTVFWADGSDADIAEGIFSAMIEGVDDDIDEGSEAKKVGAILDKLRAGKRLKDFDPGLAKGVRFYVLGLAPNAARLSVRFWFEGDFGTLAENYLRFMADMEIAPRTDHEAHAPLWRYLVETAAMRKRENVPPNLAGEWLRAILAGTRYPLTLLSNVLMRLRADKHINALRVAMLKAVLIRNYKMEVPVALDSDNTNKGYLLGRLFAAYEQTQSAALGRRVNATVKDKFYGAASAQPRKVFALLESNSANHLSKVGKRAPGYKETLEKVIGGIMDLMSPSDDPFPPSLSSEQQALFGLGYYHQRNAFFKSKTDEKPISEEAHK